MTPGAGSLLVSYDATAVPSNPVGAGRYTIDLARALAAASDVDLSIWARAGDGGRIAHAVTDGVSAVTGAPRIVARAPRPRLARLAWEQTLLPGLIARAGADVHHAPHYTMPERCKVPVVVTIHDMTFFDHPEWHERSKVPVFRRAIKRAVRNAAVLVCVSRATEERLEALTSPRCPVVVVPHGVDHSRFRPAAGVEDGQDADVLRRLGVTEPYAFFVGTIEPRKAVGSLIVGFDVAARETRDLSLVIAGGSGWGSQDVKKTASSVASRDRIRFLGYVSDSDVPVLMRRAAVVVYPAVEEGFGLPALEAMACGAPLVTTRGTAMEEVTADAALLVGADETETLGAAISESVSGGPEVRARIDKGLDIAARYTWEASAAGHVAAYRTALESARRRPARPV